MISTQKLEISSKGQDLAKQSPCKCKCNEHCHAGLQAHHSRVSWNAHAPTKKVEAPTDSKQSTPACDNDAAGFLQKRAQGLRVHTVLPIHIFCHLLPCAGGAHVVINTSSTMGQHSRRAWQQRAHTNAHTIPLCMHTIMKDWFSATVCALVTQAQSKTNEQALQTVM
jgi:hypothetical protein